MASVRKQILQRLEADLSNIKTVNGYSTTIKNIYNGLKKSDAEVDYPSIAFAFDKDVIEEEMEGVVTKRTADLLLFGYLQADLDQANEGKLAYKIENFNEDIEKFFYGNNNVPNEFTTTLNKIDGLLHLKIADKYSYPSGLGINKTVTLTLLKFTYIVDNISEDENISTFNTTAN